MKDLDTTRPTQTTRPKTIDGSSVVEIEGVKTELNAFLAEYFKIYQTNYPEVVNPSMQKLLPLSQVNYEIFKEDDASLARTYIVNPETVGMNYKERVPKIKILDMKEFIGKSILEVIEYVVKTYGTQYYIPGLEYHKYLFDNPDKVPEELKDGNFYYCVGSIFRGESGTARILWMMWLNGRLFQDGPMVSGYSGYWHKGERVILFER